MPRLVPLLSFFIAASLVAVESEDPPIVAPKDETETSDDHLRYAAYDEGGFRLGGIIGASFETTFKFEPDWNISPTLTTGIGLSGTKIALGAHLALGEHRWEIRKGQGPIAIHTFQVTMPRLVAFYRWEQHEREPDFLRGIADDEGWYLGGELPFKIFGVAFDVDLTWNKENNGVVTTVAYGLSF